MYSWNLKENILVFADGNGVTRMQFGKGDPKVKTSDKAHTGTSAAISVDKDGTKVLVYEDSFDRSMRLTLPGLAVDHAYKRFDLRNGWLCPDGSAVVLADGDGFLARTFLTRRKLGPFREPDLGPVGTGTPAWHENTLRVSPDGFLAYWHKSGLIYGILDESAESLAIQFCIPILTPPQATPRAWPHRDGVIITWHCPGVLGEPVGTIGWISLDPLGRILDQQSYPGQSIPVVHGTRIAWIHNLEAVLYDQGTLSRYPLPSWGDLILGTTRLLFLPIMGEEVHDLLEHKVYHRAMPASSLEVRTRFADIAIRMSAACREAGVYTGISTLSIKDGRFFPSWRMSGQGGTLLGGIAAGMVYRTGEIEGVTEQIGNFRGGGYSGSGGVGYTKETITLEKVRKILDWTIRHRVWPATLAHPLNEGSYTYEDGAKKLLRRAVFESITSNRPCTEAEIAAFAQHSDLPPDGRQQVETRFANRSWHAEPILKFCFGT